MDLTQPVDTVGEEPHPSTTPTLIKVGDHWINPAYVIRVWDDTPAPDAVGGVLRQYEPRTIIRFLDGSVVVVSQPADDVAAVILTA